MTDSHIKPGKRDRLVAAAATTFYQQGVEATTLADIAQAAAIPVGNVYYYFRAKDDLVAAVIDAHAQEIRAVLAGIEASHPTPAGRLKALLCAQAGQSDIVRYGCPQGSLCQELGKRAGGPDGDGPDASPLMGLPLEWAERQFAAMGRLDARDLAVQVIAGYEGAALLASALRDASLLERESRRLASWIDSLAPH
jgi:AcrR family transcriptional regulator